MQCLGKVLRRAWCLAAVFACGGAFSFGAEPASSAAPLTYLFDAPEEPAADHAAEWLAKKSGWSTLNEDDTAHRFAGCAVLSNDKIVAVLREGTPDVDLYSRQTLGLKLCARLQPVCGAVAGLTRTSLTIQENTRSSISLRVGFRSPGNGPRYITYALDAGAAFVKTTAGAGVERLRVQAPCRFAVLPDFFGDDIVVDAAAIPVPRAELPSENFVLHMLHGGEAILMTVAESRDQDAEVAVSGAAPRQIVRSDISYGKKPHVWIAILAGKGIWRQHTIALADAGKTIDLDWKMPFPALWRVDWSTADKLAESWEMLLQDPHGKYVMQGWFGQDESAGQRFGKEFGDRDWNKPGRERWNPVLGSFAFPCWIDNDCRGHLQPLRERRCTEGGAVCNFTGPAILYPIDRVKIAPWNTPIECLTVVDLVRMTLGVGPCQYILDLEGQKRGSRGVATCYARDVINAIYKQRAQLRNRSVIEEQLAAAVAFITNVRERIDAYVKFGHEVRTYLEEQKRLHPRHAEFLDELLSVAGRLDQFYAENRARIRTPAYAQQTADGFRRDLLSYTEEDAYQKCAAQMGVFTSMGGAQDGLVASCRMIVKTLRQRSGIAMTVHPELKEIAAEVRVRTQAILRNPTPYEAPRH
ncbi:MAG: hypothetical protein ACLQNE_28700 [Thermoguttaceae bacterium]